MVSTHSHTSNLESLLIRSIPTVDLGGKFMYEYIYIFSKRHHFFIIDIIDHISAIFPAVTSL
jgi:hypothetical protein